MKPKKLTKNLNSNKVSTTVTNTIHLFPKDASHHNNHHTSSLANSSAKLNYTTTLSKKIKAGLTILLLTFVSQISAANSGIAAGRGHSITLISSDNIKMVREVVTITPRRGPFLFDGSVKGMNRVEYDCLFELKNLNKNPTKIQVGFPLDDESHSHPHNKNQTVEDLVSQYKFKVQEGKKTHSIRHSRNEKKQKLNNLLLWDLKFEAEETKIIRVSYTMKISMGIAAVKKIRQHHHTPSPGSSVWS